MSIHANLMSPEHRQNPYPLYAELRARPPVQVEPLGMWTVARYEDAVTVLKDPQRFTSAARRRAMPDWVKRPRPGRNLVMMDPPEHTRLRNLVSRAFSAAALARLEARIRERANRLAERVVQQREVDFVSGFAMPLPAFVIGDMLGLDESLHGLFKQWADDMMSLSAYHHTEERKARINRSYAEMDAYFSEVLAKRRAHPKEDMVSELLRAEVDGQPLSEDELMGFMTLLLVAGLETTIHLLSNTMLTLAAHPSVLARAKADLASVPRVVEEVLRYESPIHTLVRYTTQPVELAGGSIPAQAPVVVLLASAGRDEAQFPHADAFRPFERDKPSNLSFGHGPHYCLGAMLSRLEARLGLEALLPRIQGFTRLTDQVEWMFSLSVRGPTSLPLAFTPA